MRAQTGVVAFLAAAGSLGGWGEREALSFPSLQPRLRLGGKVSSPPLGGRGAVVMETGSGAPPPPPPPRYNAPHSMLHAMKGLGPGPLAPAVPAEGLPASSRAVPNLVTMDTVEAAVGTNSATAEMLTRMTTETLHVTGNDGSVASPVPVAAMDVIAMGDVSSAVTVPVALPPAVATVNGTSVTPSPHGEMVSSPVALPTETTVKPLPVPPASPTVVVVAPSPVTPPEKTVPAAPEDLVPHDFSAPLPPRDMGSQSSLGTQAPKPPPAPDTLSYLDSVSLMSGTLESLTGPGFLDDASSLGSDSEINGLAYRKTDRYGFLGGGQYSVAL